jgi:hypothetical protein
MPNCTFSVCASCSVTWRLLKPSRGRARAPDPIGLPIPTTNMEKTTTPSWGKTVRIATETHEVLETLRKQLDKDSVSKVSLADTVAYLLKHHHNAIN